MPPPPPPYPHPRAGELLPVLAARGIFGVTRIIVLDEGKGWRLWRPLNIYIVDPAIARENVSELALTDVVREVPVFSTSPGGGGEREGNTHSSSSSSEKNIIR